MTDASNLSPPSGWHNLGVGIMALVTAIVSFFRQTATRDRFVKVEAEVSLVSTRVAVVEERTNGMAARLERIENKLDRIGDRLAPGARA